MADEFLTYEGVAFQKVPVVSSADTPEWDVPTSPISYEADEEVHSPPYLGWLGAATDQGQDVQVEIRWPVAVTAALKRALLVVDVTGISATFEREPVEVSDSLRALPGDIPGYMARGYGYDYTENDISGYVWNQPDWVHPTWFTFDLSEFPVLGPVSNSNTWVSSYMAHDHYAGPILIQPVDFSPGMEADDGGYYMRVDGNVIWPAGGVRPTVDFYLPQWTGAASSIPPGTVNIGDGSPGALPA